MNNIQIKRISVIDLEVLQIISKQTFFETFANENSESDMKQYLDENLIGIPRIETVVHYSNTESSYWLYTLKVDNREDLYRT
jgi:hypothetical protein